MTTLLDGVRTAHADVEVDPLESGMRAWLAARSVDIGRPGATGPDGMPRSTFESREPNPYDLPRAMTEAAILAYRAAKAQCDRAVSLGLPGTSAWEDLMYPAVQAAEHHLVRAILLWSPGAGHGTGDVEPDNLIYGRHPARGIEYDGKLWLAVSLKDITPGDVSPGEPVMRLAVVDLLRVDPLVPAPVPSDPTPPVPEPDDATGSIARDIVARAVGTWEAAREAAWVARQVAAGTDAHHFAEHDARRLEMHLASAILRHAAGEPAGGDPMPSFDGERVRPAAVRLNGITYIVARDPGDEMGAWEDIDEPIVVRLRDDRTAEF